jgi:acetyl esterase/lipase
MAPIDRRLRLWAMVVRRHSSVVTRGEAALLAMQARSARDNPVTNFILGTKVPGVTSRDQAIPGPAGEIGVRIYTPARAWPGPGARPLVVNYHGGGFVFGNLRLADWLCSSVARQVGAVVVSVDYRLAPAHRFPAAVQDSYAALAWAAGSADALGAGGPVGVMGESAGASLSAVMALLARDRGPALRHQVLLYPATDMTRAAPTPEGEKTPFLAPSEMAAYRRYYLADADPADFRASPLLAADHHGLPPALIQVGEHDPLRGDGERYAAALRAAGVAVRLTTYVGMPHGYLNFPGLCRLAAQALAEICAEQTAALAPASARA